MMDKFNKLADKKDDPNATSPATPDPDLALEQGQIAEESLVDLQKQKERIQTLFQYNNVISSYMAAKTEGEDTELSYQRDIELDGMSKFGDEKEKEKYEEYSKILSDDNARASSGNEQMEVNVDFIEEIMLGDSE